MSHKCHAIGCKLAIREAHFMCSYHWRWVPISLRNRILAHYRAGQENDKKPSAEYCRVAKRAVIAVADKLSVPYTGTENELVLYDIFERLAINTENARG